MKQVNVVRHSFNIFSRMRGRSGDKANHFTALISRTAEVLMIIGQKTSKQHTNKQWLNHLIPRPHLHAKPFQGEPGNEASGCG